MKKSVLISIIVGALVLVSVVLGVVLSTPNHTHKYGAWETVSEANCTQKGMQERVCECGEAEQREINAIGHTFGEWETVKEATCTEKGKQERTCKCGETMQREINPTGHDWGNATCTTPRSCLVCWEIDPNSDELGHLFIQGECARCGEDDPDYVTLTLTATKTNVDLSNGSDVVYITMVGADTVVYDIDDTSVVNCEWGEWNGDTIPLTFTPVSSGQTTVTVYIEGYDKSITINVYVAQHSHSYNQGICESCGDADIKLQQMSALAIDTAYNSAKFPSTLRLDMVTYEDRINGYGDSITRMVIRCYATNSFGGYSYIYVVVLCCEYETDYIDFEWDGLYFQASAYNDSPGMCDYTLDNEVAMNAYKKLITNSKEIPYN